MLLSDAITRYLNDLTVRRGHYTLRNHTACLKTFTRYVDTLPLPEQPWTVESALTLSQCRAFMVSLTLRELRPKTVKGYVITLRGVVRFLHEEGVLPED